MNQEVWGLLRLPMYTGSTLLDSTDNVCQPGDLPCINAGKVHVIPLIGRGTVIMTHPLDAQSRTLTAQQIAHGRMLEPKIIQKVQAVVHADVLLLTVKIFFRMVDSLPSSDAHDWLQHDTILRAHFGNRLHLTVQDITDAHDETGHYLRYLYVPITDDFDMADLLQCIAHVEGWNSQFFNASLMIADTAVDVEPDCTTKTLMKIIAKLTSPEKGATFLRVVGPCRKCPGCLEPCIDGHAYTFPHASYGI